MKIIAVLFLAFMNAVAHADGASAADQAPLYVAEFISKLGITPRDFAVDAPVQVEVKRLVEKLGLEPVWKNAESAKDNYSGVSYFHIVNSDDAVVIGKRYALENEYVTFELFLYKDRSGKLTRATLTRGIMVVRAPQKEEPKAQP
jgi:signal recognition particle subunit SEC65